jgi:hypothetical protein
MAVRNTVPYAQDAALLRKTSRRTGEQAGLVLAENLIRPIGVLFGDVKGSGICLVGRVVATQLARCILLDALMVSGPTEVAGILPGE